MDKYAYGDIDDYDEFEDQRQEDLHIRNMAVGGYKVPSSVLKKQRDRKTYKKKKPDDQDLREEQQKLTRDEVFSTLNLPKEQLEV